jgi:splicing factor 3B subunit 1
MRTTLAPPHAHTRAQPSLNAGRRITDREDDYKKRRLGRMLSPDRNDAFTSGDKTPDARVRTYADVMREQQLAREQANTLQNIADKARAEKEAAEAAGGAAAAANGAAAAAAAAAAPAVGQKRRNRWDVSSAEEL